MWSQVYLKKYHGNIIFWWKLNDLIDVMKFGVFLSKNWTVWNIHNVMSEIFTDNDRKTNLSILSDIRNIFETEFY